MPFRNLAENGNIGTLDSSNSSSAILAAGATFTGGWTPVEYFSALTIAVKTDKDGTIYADFSTDATNVDSTLTYTTLGTNGGDVHRLSITRRFFRVRFTNTSATDQTYFRLQVLLGTQVNLSSPLNTVIQQDSDATVVRNIDFEFDIAAGRTQGITVVNKFGRNPSISSNSTPEDVWGGGSVYTGFPTGAAETVQIFSSSADDASAGTGTRTVQIIGLDANYAVQTETLTLNGTTPVVSSGLYTRVHTASARSAGASNQAFNAGEITVRHSSSTANIFQVIEAGTNQSYSCGYTIPAGFTGYIRTLHGSIQGGTSSALDASLWIRVFGQPPRLRRPFVIPFGTELEDTIYGGIPCTEKTDIHIRVTASSGNSIKVAAGYDLILVQN